MFPNPVLGPHTRCTDINFYFTINTQPFQSVRCWYVTLYMGMVDKVGDLIQFSAVPILVCGANNVFDEINICDLVQHILIVCLLEVTSIIKSS